MVTYLASIFSLFTSGAKESGMQFEVITESSTAQFVLTLGITNYRHIHFLIASSTFFFTLCSKKLERFKLIPLEYSDIFHQCRMRLYPIQ
jgi:hypothetical protein